MKYDDLLKILEIEDASEFQNFEEFAVLLECEETLEYDAIQKVLADVNEDTLAELIKSYFDEIAESLPDSATESYIFLEMIVRVLTEKLYDEKAAFIEELFTFRNWYLFDSEVEVIDEKEGSLTLSFFDAVTSHRAAKFVGVTDNIYKFDEALNYRIDA